LSDKVTPATSTTIRDDHGLGVPEWTPAGVWIFSQSRSHYFRF